MCVCARACVRVHVCSLIPLLNMSMPLIIVPFSFNLKVILLHSFFI